MKNLKKLNKKQRSSSDNFMLSKGMIIIIIFAIGLALLYVRIKVEEVSLGYEISRNKKKTEELLKENRILHSEFMKLKSPKKLEPAAMELGFKFPTQNDIIYIENNKVVGK